MTWGKVIVLYISVDFFFQLCLDDNSGVLEKCYSSIIHTAASVCYIFPTGCPSLTDKSTKEKYYNVFGTAKWYYATHLGQWFNYRFFFRIPRSDLTWFDPYRVPSDEDPQGLCTFGKQFPRFPFLFLMRVDTLFNFALFFVQVQGVSSKNQLMTSVWCKCILSDRFVKKKSTIFRNQLIEFLCTTRDFLYFFTF